MIFGTWLGSGTMPKKKGKQVKKLDQLEGSRLIERADEEHPPLSGTGSESDDDNASVRTESV